MEALFAARGIQGNTTIETLDLQPLDSFLRILEARWESVLTGMPSTQYFNTHDPEPFQALVTEFTQGLEPHPAYTFCQYDGKKFHEPFEPFLGLIRTYMSAGGVDADQLLHSVQVYPPQLPVFRSYLAGINDSRKDIVIVQEAGYEKVQIRRSIFALLRAISRERPIIIAISGLSLAGPAILDLIKFIQTEGSDARILFLYAFDRQAHLKEQTEQESWNDFLRFADESGAVLDIAAERTAILEDVPDSGEQSATELVRIAKMDNDFFAFEEALECGTAASPIVAALSGPDGSDLQYTLLNALGDAYYNTNRMNEALINYQALTEKAQRDDNKPQLSNSYIKTGFVNIATGDIDSAKRFSLLNLKIAESLGLKYYLMRAYFFCYLLSTRTSDFIDRDMYFKLKELLKEPGLENMYAFFCGDGVIYAYNYGSFEEVLAVCAESIKYYRANRNEFGLSFAYHKMAIVYSNAKRFDEAAQYLKKSIRIRERLGDILQIIYVLNGLGYLDYLTGNYAHAFACYRKALSHLSRLNDYDEIITTLNNFGNLLYTTGNYERCIDLMDNILKIMYIMRKSYFPYHCIEDVHILKGLCLAKTGSTAMVLEIVYRIRNSQRPLPWKTTFMFNLLQGIVASAQSDPDGASAYFNAAFGSLSRSDEGNSDILPGFYFEYASALIKSGRKPEAEELIRKGIDSCSLIPPSAGADFHVNRLTVLGVAGPGEETAFPLPPLKFDLGSLVELARKEYIITRLENEIRDIRFLNIIQTELMQLGNRKDVAEKLIKLVYYHFPMEISSFHLVEGDSIGAELASNATESATVESLAPLRRMALANPGKRLFGRNDIHIFCPDYTGPVSSMTAIPIMRGNKPTAWLFLATEKEDMTLNTGELEVLMVTAGHIGFLFEKIHHEEEIMRISRHDALSGLYNRQALQSKIKEESQRPKGRRANDAENLSVAFIDLDNFKYYNDTFGHNVGDLIIVEFSNLLLRNFREIDFVARYGGDEFVILMPDTNSLFARLPLLRIFSQLAERNHFIGDISRSVGQGVHIDEGNLVSCSIGVASFENDSGRELSIGELMMHADRALYEAKRCGKNQLKLWSELPPDAGSQNAHGGFQNIQELL